MSFDGSFITGSKPEINKDLQAKLKAVGKYTFKGTVISSKLIKPGGKLIEYRIAELGAYKIVGFLDLNPPITDEIELEVKHDDVRNQIEVWLQRVGSLTAQQGQKGKGKGFVPKSEREILAIPLATVIGDCVKVSKGDPAAFDAIAGAALERFHKEVARLRQS